MRTLTSLFVLLALISLASFGFAQGDCAPPPTGGGGGGTPVPQSCDPNEVSGPLGFGDAATQRFVLPGQWLEYIVYFENRATATAAAQAVRVTNPLSPYLDWASFELREVGFNAQVDLALAGRSNGQSEVVLNGTDYTVRTEISVNPATGVAICYLRIVDAGTADAWPLDAYAGFLPPNDDTHRGEGHVTYRVKVRADAAPGTRIDNSATIVFDTNAPLETDPAWFNTVAGDLPGTPTGPDPVAGARLPSPSPLLSWEEGAAASSYRLWVWVDGEARPETPTVEDLLTASFQTAGLVPGTAYRWQVEAVNLYGSTPGPEWTFSLGQPPAQPLALEPPSGATDVSLTPALTASAFADGDVGDTHAASQWQVAPTLDFAASVWDSGAAAGQASTAVPAGRLQRNTAYCWRVRYQDNRAEWSEWSVAVGFTTYGTHTLDYASGANGSLVGEAHQTVEHGADGSPVVAVPDEGYHFVGWSDGLDTAVRQDLAVTGGISASAHFATSGPTDPEGGFHASIDASDVVSGRGLWDLTGSYTPSTRGNLRSLNLVHDPSGRLSGTATYAVAEDTAVTMPIKGSVKGTSGSITMKGTMRGSGPDRTLAVSLTLNLRVDAANRQLAGLMTGSVKAGRVSTQVNAPVVLDIPGGMDGTWTLQFQLDQSGKKITGTALLTLSNTVDHAFVVKGKVAGQTAVLSLAGDPGAPAAGAIRIRTTITPLEGGWARLEALSAMGYGQTVTW